MATVISRTAEMNQLAPPENVLQVVLHGFVCLFDVGSGFNAYLLDMQDAHTYMYGDWMYEIPFAPRAPGQSPVEATLSNVDWAPISADNILNPAMNVVVKVGAAPSLVHPLVRVLLHLPRPRKIYHYVSGKLKPDSLQGTAGDIGKIVPTPQFISACRVLEYTFSDRSTVNLSTTIDSQLLWSPVACPVVLKEKNKNVSILHIYDEPLFEHNTATDILHSINEFNQSMSFLGVKITLTTASDDAPIATTSPDGLIPEEVNALDQRRTLLTDLLNKNRGGNTR